VILVFGLGRSGLGVLRFLARRGLSARFYDDRPKDEEVAQALALGFTPDWQLAGAYREVVAAPGVPLAHPKLEALAARGALVMGEAELAYRLSPTPIIGITGTAGKTSTTLFTAHLLRGQGLWALEGGNVDPPLVSVVDEAEVAVAELSSFQLERIHRFRPRVAVLLNLGVDHLDRHGSLEAYHAAKLNLLKNLTPEDALVYNQEDPRLREAASRTPARPYPFTPGNSPRESNLKAALEATRAYLNLLGRPLDEKALERASKPSPSPPTAFRPSPARGRWFSLTTPSPPAPPPWPPPCRRPRPPSPGFWEARTRARTWRP